MPSKKLLTGALLCSLVSLSVSACSSASPAIDAGSKPATSPSLVTTDPKIIDPLPGLRLPIQEYIETNEQAQRATQARLNLVDNCLESMHVKFKPTPVSGSTPPSLMAGRYGPVNQDQARYGYHFMVVIGGPGTATRKEPPASAKSAVEKCSEEAVEKVPSLEDKGLPDEIKQTSYIKSIMSPKAVSAFNRWSQCMSTAGYSYKSPMDAMRDPRWNWKSGSPSHEEISTARRDVQCKQNTGVVNAWFRAEADLQESDINQRKRDLDGIRKQIEKRAQVAREILKEHSA
ncbi:hypothetical protein ACWCQW_21875 [Streptomyces mirabilis]